MEQKDTGQLGKELWGLVSEIGQFELTKRKKRHEIDDYEAQIKKLKESSSYVPKQLWKLENQLAAKVRERNALVDRIREMRIDGMRKKQALVSMKQETLRKELEMKRPRTRAREWKRPRTRALGWKRPRRVRRR